MDPLCCNRAVQDAITSSTSLGGSKQVSRSGIGMCILLGANSKFGTVTQCRSCHPPESGCCQWQVHSGCTDRYRVCRNGFDTRRSVQTKLCDCQLWVSVSIGGAIYGCRGVVELTESSASRSPAISRDSSRPSVEWEILKRIALQHSGECLMSVGWDPLRRSGTMAGIEGVCTEGGAHTHLLPALRFPIRTIHAHKGTYKKKRSRHISLTAPPRWIIAHTTHAGSTVRGAVRHSLHNSSLRPRKQSELGEHVYPKAYGESPTGET